MTINTTHELKLNIAFANKAYEKVSLVEPTTSGYIHIAIEVDRRLPFLPASKKKHHLLQTCKQLCQKLEQKEHVQRATLFRAILAPPGRGAFLRQRPHVHRARFDIAIFIETSDVTQAQLLRNDADFIELEHAVRRVAHYVHIINASNIKQIGPVDHQRNGIFLFNYFFSDTVEQNLAVWAYTAGWFEKETALNNSTLLLPTDSSESEYSLVNHCRWDRLQDIIPSLLFKRSFRSYVLGNFEANNTAAGPIFYRLA